MSKFFDDPILNSPYAYPDMHWELIDGQPTEKIVANRRCAEFITPISKSKKQKTSKQQELELGTDDGLSTDKQKYDEIPIINELRTYVDEWRKWPNSNEWQVTPETARLLQHWRHHEFQGIRPFFCQVEAVEVAIWLTEVAPKSATGKKFLAHLENASAEANPEIMRLALKLATGAGKTTVMAMLIAWQTINAARRPASKEFTKGFLIVTPGITIRDRLRVLMPNSPDSYYDSRELVPSDMAGDLQKAKIVITNYHSFKLRERIDLAKGTRGALEGWRGDKMQTLETEGQMLQRVMPELMGMKNILVLNDEAHHCYREKPQPDEDDSELKGDDRKEAEQNNEAARLWISGIEAVNRKLGVANVIDLSATPFFLRGSGYLEGTLFPWTMSDFSLMDAIECGIVKLPRVPVADNVPGGDMPKFRERWKHIGSKMPKKGRAKAGDKEYDPLSIPRLLESALGALYGHYEKTFDLWQEAGIRVPPCFIVVCNNTSTSKLVHDYISGFERIDDNGNATLENGRLPLFRNFDEHGNRLARPRTLLIDSRQLESGDALDSNFRNLAGDEIERFRQEIVQRSGNIRDGESISDSDLLREVMNTVGKVDRLGESIRCVVSVSMLTEGWDTNTVTHVLGVRAFGTQLLCEQVIGRALRRQSYDLKLGKVPVLKARMNADLHMADELKNTGKGNLFVIFGEPDIDILPAKGDDAKLGQIQVKINGVDVFHPQTGEVRSDGADGIACWFIDTNYNEESFFVRHAYFLGAGDPCKSLKTTLKAEINAEAWATLNSDTSRPFDKPKTGRIAVKVINHLGDEVMKVFRVTETLK